MQAVRELDGKDIKRMFLKSVEYIKSHKDMINKINVFPVPDGDTGTNLFSTLSSVSNEIREIDVSEADKVLEAIAMSSLMNSRGNSGMIISQFFAGLYEKSKGKKKLSVRDFVEALKCAKEYAYKALSSPKEGTILTVIKDAVKEASESVRHGESVLDVIKSAVHGAQESLKRTKEQLKELENYGVVDAGGLGFLYILEGWMVAFNMRPPKVSVETPVKRDARIKFRYCTEILFIGQSEGLFGELARLGDSVEVGKLERYVKVHVHTNEPWKVQRACSSRGIIKAMKVDDMKILHRHMFFSRD